MKKLWVVAGGVVCAAVGAWAVLVSHQPQPVVDVPRNTTVAAKPPLVEPPEMAKPKRMVIPSLNIDALIEPSGLISEGDMAVPENRTIVGWYAGGTMPGNPGRAVLAAHTGYPNRPTEFRQFENLKQDDEVKVIDAAGQAAVFQVIRTARYSPEAAPRQLIFGESTTARLALITCIGEWLPEQETYAERLVVYAVRVR